VELLLLQQTEALAVEPLLLLLLLAAVVEALVLVVRAHRHQQQRLRVDSHLEDLQSLQKKQKWPHLPRFLVALASEVLHRELQSQRKSQVVDSLSEVVLQQRRHHQQAVVEALRSAGLQLPQRCHQ
jgi:hypothetical protein